MKVRNLVLPSEWRRSRMYARATSAIRPAAQDIDPTTDLSDRMEDAKRDLREKKIPYIEAGVEVEPKGQLFHTNNSRSPMYGHSVLVVGGKVQNGIINGGIVMDLLCKGPVPTENYHSEVYGNQPRLRMRVESMYDGR